MHREREKDTFKSREVKRLKECTLALTSVSSPLYISVQFPDPMCIQEK